MFDDNFEWRDTFEFEERYQTSFYGDIISKPRIKIRKNGRPFTIRGKTLSTYTNEDGYLMVQLHSMDGDNHPKLVHKLVWESFYGKVPEGLEIGHWDGDCKNNVLTNLYLCTHITNCQHIQFKSKRHTVMLGNTLSKGLISPNRISIVCLDLDYKLIKTYDYVSQVTEDGFGAGNVCRCCKGMYGKKGNVTKNRIFMTKFNYEKMLAEQPC